MYREQKLGEARSFSLKPIKGQNDLYLQRLQQKRCWLRQGRHTLLSLPILKSGAYKLSVLSQHTVVPLDHTRIIRFTTYNKNSSTGF